MINEAPTLSQSYSSDDNDSDGSVDGCKSQIVTHRQKLSLRVDGCIEEDEEDEGKDEEKGSVSIDFALRGHRLYYVLTNSACVKEVLDVVKEETGAGLQAVHYRHGRSESLLHVLEQNKCLVENLRVPLVANEQQSIRMVTGSQLLSSKRSLSSKDDHFGLLEEILKHLLWEYPRGASIKDKDNYVPFARSLAIWIEEVYIKYSLKKSVCEKLKASRDLHGSYLDFQMLRSPVARLRSLSIVSKMSKTSFRSSAASTPRFSEKHSNENQDLESLLPQQSYGITPSQASEWENFFPETDSIPLYIEWSLYALSFILDNIEEAVGSRIPTKTSFKSEHQEISKDIVECVASIPFLIKTILLINDDDVRSRILEMSVIKRVMRSEASLDTWLVSFLKSNNMNLCDKAVLYLQIVSAKPPEDIKNSDKLNDYRAQQNDLFKAAARLEGLIPSMLLLDTNAIEKISTIKIVRLALDKLISEKTAFSIIFLDAFFLLSWIISFRRSLYNFLINSETESEIALTWTFCANTCLLYFCIRDFGKIVALKSVNSKVFQRHLLRVWFVFEISALPTTLVTTYWIRFHIYDEDKFEVNDEFVVLASLTTALLWIRVISLLKSLNKQLATFIWAVYQIVQDILWFLVFLVVLVIASGQLIFTAQCNPQSSEGDKICGEEYYEHPSKNYYAAYKILLGDLSNLDEDLVNPYVTFLIVVYSFLVIVILLNVLIAIISDSHEKCLARSSSIFGRARALLLAELVSFQYLLARRHETEHSWLEKVPDIVRRSKYFEEITKSWSTSSIFFFTVSMIMCITSFMVELLSFIYLNSAEISINKIGAFTCILTNILIFIILRFLFRGDGEDVVEEENDKSQNKFLTHIKEVYLIIVNFFMSRILDTNDQAYSISSEGNETSWQGRTDYLRRKIEKNVKESKVDALAQIRSLLDEKTDIINQKNNDLVGSALMQISEETKTALNSHVKEDISRSESGALHRYLALKQELSANSKSLDHDINALKTLVNKIDFDNRYEMSVLRSNIMESEERMKKIVEENASTLLQSISVLLQEERKFR